MDDHRERERERAIQLGYRAVGSRERTVAELRTFLERKRVEPEAIDDAVTELAEDKRELELWGSERIARELQRRGVRPELIELAIADRSREAELHTALMVLEQRLPPPADDRERDRAWRLLVRRGYEPEVAYEAVRRHERPSGDRRAA